MTVKARVFSLNGNKFLIPGYWCDEEDENWDGMSISSILCDGMMLGVVCGFDKEQEWMEFKADAEGRADLHHVAVDMTGPQFKHGGIKVLLISGPMFDEMAAPKVSS